MRKFLTFFTLLCAAPCSAAAPGAVVHTEQVRAELLAYAPRGLAAGEPAWLGLAIKHQPHWHSYWKNPGDSGMATTLRWALPAGVTVGEIEWPTPQRLALGPLVNHGYEGELLLPVALTLAPGFRETTLQVQLHAEWLVCKDVCIAQSGDFALSIPVGALRPVHLKHAPVFARARAAMPQAIAGASAVARVDASALAISVTGLPQGWRGRAVEFFAEDAGVFDHAAAIEQRWAGSQLALRVPLSAQRSESPPTLGAVLVAAAAQRDRAGVALSIRLQGGWPMPGLAQAPESVQPSAAPRPVQPWPGSMGASATGLVLLGGAALALGLGLALLWAHHARSLGGFCRAGSEEPVALATGKPLPNPARCEYPWRVPQAAGFGAQTWPARTTKDWSMKTWLKLTLLTGALLTATSAAAQAGVGQLAPAFVVGDTQGRPVALGDFKGRHVVLEWVNPGCPYVQKHYNSGNMPATQKAARAKDVVWLTINSTAPDHHDYRKPNDLDAWLKGKGSAMNATLMDVDGKVGRAYGARTTPHMVVIDPLGRLVYAGAIDSIPSANTADIASATNYVNQALGELLAGKAVSKPTSNAYGCSIKYPNAG